MWAKIEAALALPQPVPGLMTVVLKADGDLDLLSTHCVDCTKRKKYSKPVSRVQL